MHKCTMVKIGEAKQFRPKLTQKSKFNAKNWETFINFAEVGGIYNSFGNREEYAICIIGLGGWTPLRPTNVIFQIG